MTSSRINHIAFIGLGAMGVRMANRLLDAGYTLTVHNRTASRGDELVARGARWATSPREAAAGADTVIVMVTDDNVSRQCGWGPMGCAPDWSEARSRWSPAR